VVSTPAGPPAVFSSVQTAVSSAVIDGHNAANPAVVLIHPGTYTEDVVLSDGIQLAGFSGDDGAGVVIVGDITANDGSNTISSLDVQGTITFGGATGGTLTLRKVSVTPVIGNEAVAYTRTAGELGSRLNLQDCVLTSNFIAFPPLLLTGDNLVEAWHTTFNAPAGGIAVQVNTAATTSWDDCVFGEQFNSLAGDHVFFRCDFTAADQPVFQLGGGTYQLFACTWLRDAGAGLTVDGTSSQFAYDRLTWRGLAPLTIPTFGASVVTKAMREVLANTVASFAGAGPFTPGAALPDLSVVTPGASPTIFDLPSLASVADGMRVTIKQVANAAFLTVVNAAGGEFIDGLPAFTFAAGAHAIELQADHADGEWWVLSKF
jgi:hypothetical protein